MRVVESASVVDIVVVGLFGFSVGNRKTCHVLREMTRAVVPRAERPRKTGRKAPIFRS